MEDLACFVDRSLAGLALEKSDSGQRSSNDMFLRSALFVNRLKASQWLSVLQEFSIAMFCGLVVAARTVNATHAM